MNFDKYELTEAMETVADALENAMKEIKMWRDRYGFYMERFDIGINDEKCYQFLQEKLLTFPAGIEDIEEFIEKELKCYRETQEKNK